MKNSLVIPWGPLAGAGEGLETQGVEHTGIIFPRDLSWVVFSQPWLTFPLRSLAMLKYFCGGVEEACLHVPLLTLRGDCFPAAQATSCAGSRVYLAGSLDLLGQTRANFARGVCCVCVCVWH